MPAGTVKWFNNAKGYGFIVSDGTTEDIFAHYSAILMDGYKTLKAGQPVAFDTMQAERGIHAVNIKPCTTEEEAIAAALSEQQSQSESAAPMADDPVTPAAASTSRTG